MKKIHLLLSLPLALGAMSVGSGVAHADLLTYYNFNDNNVPTAPYGANLTSDSPGIQTTNIITNFTSSNVTSNATGSTTNRVTGDASGTALSLVAGTGTVNNGKYIQFNFNTVNYKDTVFSFATQRSNTGFKNNQFSYSTDGSTFTDFGSSFDPGTATYASSRGLQSFNLGSVVDNQASITFRLTFSGATDDAGSNQIDNIQVNANAIMATPEPETWAMMALGVGALAMFSWKRKRSAEEASFGGGLAI